MNDSYQHKGLRKRLVETLRKRGVLDEKILAAFSAVPRHFFLDNAFAEHAYEDKPFSIGHGQTISQPFTVAYQTQLLEVQAREKVLEIGTGSGYQAAILAELGARVYSVERQEALFLKTQKLLADLGFSVRCFFRDGWKGLPEFAPFDKIIVTAGAPEVPEILKNQLKIGGILVVPVGEFIQKMYKITRLGEADFKAEIFDDFRFVPFLAGVEKE